MKFRVEFISHTEESRPTISLVSAEGHEICRTNSVDFQQFQGLAPFDDSVVDFFVFSASIYFLDRSKDREDAPDGWTRDFELSIPVSDPSRWSRSSTRVENLLSFLTGDRWKLEFTNRETSVFDEEGEDTSLSNFKAASLYSGGLDSFTGVVDWLEQNNGDSLVLVGHRDPKISGPKGDQEDSWKHIKSVYNGRTRPLFVGLGPDNSEDTNLRSRSLMFIGLGVCVASKIYDTAPLLIPENGTIALNPPLTPSRSGSCSTRTAHPHYLSEVNDLLEEIGISNSIINPLSEKTKGEVLSQCENSSFIRGSIHDTNSCAKRGHRNHWKRRSAKQCGHCVACIYRRAALHKIGEDVEVYGLDFCEGEVDIDDGGKDSMDDLRAFLSFLRREPSNHEIKSLLLSDGHLEVYQLEKYAGLVNRAMNEIRELLQEKATDDIKARAGLSTN